MNIGKVSAVLNSFSGSRLLFCMPNSTFFLIALEKDPQELVL